MAWPPVWSGRFQWRFGVWLVFSSQTHATPASGGLEQQRRQRGRCHRGPATSFPTACPQAGVCEAAPRDAVPGLATVLRCAGTGLAYRWAAPAIPPLPVGVGVLSKCSHHSLFAIFHHLHRCPRGGTKRQAPLRCSRQRLRPSGVGFGCVKRGGCGWCRAGRWPPARTRCAHALRPGRAAAQGLRVVWLVSVRSVAGCPLAWPRCPPLARSVAWARAGGSPGGARRCATRTGPGRNGRARGADRENLF